MSQKGLSLIEFMEVCKEILIKPNCKNIEFRIEKDQIIIQFDLMHDELFEELFDELYFHGLRWRIEAGEDRTFDTPVVLLFIRQ